MGSEAEDAGKIDERGGGVMTVSEVLDFLHAWKEVLSARHGQLVFSEGAMGNGVDI